MARKKAINENVRITLLSSLLSTIFNIGKETYSIYIYKVLKQVKTLFTVINKENKPEN